MRTTSALVGKAYSVAGQAATCLYTMYLLQAYQAELLGDHDEGGGCGQATDLSLRAMAALVATERHLWLNQSNIKREKIKYFLWMLLFLPLASSVMQLIRLSRDFSNQLNKQLHSRNSSPAVLISLGLLSGSRPKHLKPAPHTVPHRDRAWLIVLPNLNNGDTGSTL